MGTKTRPRITISDACVLFTAPSNRSRTQSRKTNSVAQISSETMPRRKSLSQARMLLAVAAALPDTISLLGDIDNAEEAGHPVH